MTKQEIEKFIKNNRKPGIIDLIAVYIGKLIGWAISIALLLGALALIKFIVRYLFL